MKYVTAYVPSTELWIVFRALHVIEQGLTKEQADIVAQFLNNQEYLANNPSKDKTVTLDFDFESIYKSFPRKLGKTSGIKWLKAHIKTLEKYSLLAQAVDNYAKHCDENVTEIKFILHFSTFVRRWEDWIPDGGEPGGIQQSMTLDELSQLMQS